MIKILYSAGNRVGADSQLARFVLHNKYQLKIAAFIKSSRSFNHIDWTLDALYNTWNSVKKQELTQLFGHSGIPNIDLNNAELLLEEIDNYNPDLIISDGEAIVAHIAQSLKIPLWYCSPLHLLDGIEWNLGQISSFSLLENTKKFLNQLPPAEKKLVYSPFGDIEMRPSLKEGYEWIQPYHLEIKNTELNNSAVGVIPDPERYSTLTRILNSVDFEIALFSLFQENFSKLITFSLKQELLEAFLSKSSWFFSTGETSFLADAFYAGISNIVISPNLKDAETILNAQLAFYYKIGSNVSQLELMGKFAVEEINYTFEKQQNRKFLSNQNRLKLHEMIESELKK